MTLHLAYKYTWDFWFAQAGSDYHVFYLQAPRSLPNPELRHWNVSIGHAVSQDLRDWHVLPDALCPGPLGDWDDYTTWTGSVVEHDGNWHLFYPGTQRAEKGLVQRIGLATSADLCHWEKYPGNPVLVPDPQWYELLDLAQWQDQAWRDPWVFRDPAGGDFHALITARVNHGPTDGRGVIAHARSTDLRQWQVTPPITEPGEFGQMEVPQLSHIAGRYYLLFSTSTHHQSATRRERVGGGLVTGTLYLVADQPFGPYHFISDEFLVGDSRGTLFAGKLLEMPSGGWVFMAWRAVDNRGEFLGELADPFPVTVSAEGQLCVELSQRPGAN